MELDRERVRTWYRADGTECLQYVMGVEELITDVAELRAANDAGMRICVTEGPGPRGITSLAFLAPVVAEIRDLWVNTVNRITDVEVLDEAVNLRSLSFEVGSFEGRVKLSALPRLEEFNGDIVRAVASVMLNPGLRFLRVHGAIPKSFGHVAGPVESFVHDGARSQTLLPIFAQPEMMRAICRIGPTSFDLTQLAEMTGLTDVEVSACDEVIGLSTLSRFESLKSVTFRDCVTPERWEDLPKVAYGFLMHISPSPSAEFLEERSEAGWTLPLLSENVLVDAVSMEESGDGESWGVYMSRFDDLAAAVDLLDGSLPGGMEGEAFVLGVIAELRGEGVVLDPQPDSESSFTAVYFPDQAQAERVFARTREALAASSEAQLGYLRMGLVESDEIEGTNT